MDSLIYWTGAVVWILAAIFWVRVLWEVLAALARTVSWCRFVIACAKVQRVPLNWSRFHLAFLGMWKDQMLREVTVEGVGGYWKGIGRWKVYPPQLGADA